MHSSVKILYDEHEVIVSVIELAKKAGELWKINPEKFGKIIVELISFFRNYADKFHHYKEEEVLFPEMNKKNELLEDGVIKEMFDNHANFREMLTNIENFAKNKNYEAASRQLLEYSEALLDHIAVENDEVFLMAESLFTKDELKKINFRFADWDRDLGEEKKREFETIVTYLQEQLAADN